MVGVVAVILAQAVRRVGDDQVDSAIRNTADAIEDILAENTVAPVVHADDCASPCASAFANTNAGACASTHPGAHAGTCTGMFDNRSALAKCIACDPLAQPQAGRLGMRRKALAGSQLDGDPAERIGARLADFDDAGALLEIIDAERR